MSGTVSPSANSSESTPPAANNNSILNEGVAGSNKRPSSPLDSSDSDSSAKRPKLAASYSMPPPTSLPLGSPLPPAPHPGGLTSQRPLSRSTSPGAASPIRSATLPHGGGAAGAATPLKEDPNDYSDALLSAGVDLREEEQLLSSSLPVRAQAFSSRQAGSFGANSGYFGNTSLTDQSYLPADMPTENSLQAHRRTPFLDLRVVRQIVSTLSNENEVQLPAFHGSTGPADSKEHDVIVLISLACQEWLSNILTSTLITSRYRRDSIIRNTTAVYSDVAKALRQVAIKDKEREDRYQIAQSAAELQNGGSGQSESGRAHDGEKSSHDTEEVMHRAANATAALMVSGGRKKYSWMTGPAAGAASPVAGSTTPGGPKKDAGGTGHGIRIREAREEQGVVMRDLLSVLESERVGVDKVITKGWTRLRD